jgi:hypothetical protein
MTFTQLLLSKEEALAVRPMLISRIEQLRQLLQEVGRAMCLMLSAPSSANDLESFIGLTHCVVHPSQPDLRNTYRRGHTRVGRGKSRAGES